MKKKTTIWTYVKRALLVVVLAVVLIFVSIYFLDVYKVAANINDFDNEYEDSYWENLEENGFLSYDVLKKQADAEYAAEGTATRFSGTKPLSTYKLPYDESANDIEKINSARFENELIYIYKLVSESAGFISTSEFEEAYALMKEKLDGVTRNDYLYYVRNKLILSNNKYDLYFNFTTTQFILNEKDEKGKKYSIGFISWNFSVILPCWMWQKKERRRKF